jgi:hypothetical protein
LSLKAIAVDGCTLQLQSGTGTIQINPGQTSTKVKCGGKAAYKTLQFVVQNYVGGAITIPIPTSGNGAINASAQKVKIEGQAALLEGDDSGTITLNGQVQSGTSVVPATATDTVKIVKAGQTKVKGA